MMEEPIACTSPCWQTYLVERHYIRQRRCWEVLLVDD